MSSDLWDYGPSTSSEDTGGEAVSVGAVAEDAGDLARYMSEEQKRKYRGVLADGKGVETVVGSGRGEEGKEGKEGKEGEEGEEEDAFEWIRRKNDEELAVPLYDDDSDASIEVVGVTEAGAGCVGGVGSGVGTDSGNAPVGVALGKGKRKRGRPPKNATRQQTPGSAEQGRRRSEGNLDAARVQKALRACLQDGDDVSDVASDEDEELRRIKEIEENEVRRREQRSVGVGVGVGVSPVKAFAGAEEHVGDQIEHFGGEVISIRFLDAKRHEFVTDAVVRNSFDYPVSKFVEHAVGAGWIGGRGDVDRFVFDDEVLQVGEDTPHGFGMEDGDTIDVHYKAS